MEVENRTLPFGIPAIVPPSTRFTPGEMYGPYKLLERVAVGGMAEVFKATQSGIGGFEKIIAVKRLLSHLSRDKSLVDMFIHEAKLAAPLSHPHIVQIFGLGQLAQSYYIAMEYVHGRDLRTIHRRASDRGIKLPLDLCTVVASRIAGALGYAHKRRDREGRALRIVHRDVSPQNILVSFDGDVKLTDFGIAKAASRATVTNVGLLRGKLSYMSPEQAMGKPISHRSDIFCLGIVLYELVTGRRPLVGNSEITLLQAIRQCRIVSPREINPRIPEKLERVIMKALEPDPDQRYQDALGLQRALDHSLGDHEPATEKELSRLMDVLFESNERDKTLEAASEVRDEDTGQIEVDLDGDEAPAPRPRPEHARGRGKDDMSIEKLLQRFRTGK